MTDEYEEKKADAADRVSKAMVALNSAVRAAMALGLRVEIQTMAIHEIGREPYTLVHGVTLEPLGGIIGRARPWP